MGTIRLFHPEFAGLSYGPNNEIQFGPKAGQADFTAVVDEDHPLLPSLMAQFPEIKVITTEGGPTEVFPCPFGDHEDFKTRAGWLDHMAAVHGIGEAGAQTPVDGPGAEDGDGETPEPARAVQARPRPAVRRPARSSRRSARKAAAAKAQPAPASPASPAADS